MKEIAYGGSIVIDLGVYIFRLFCIYSVKLYTINFFN
jgi:hypothetical protein